MLTRERGRRWRWTRGAAWLAALALTGCGSGNSSGPVTPSPLAPVISNLTAALTTQGCLTVGGVPATSESGTVQTITFQYTDADGDVSGGTVQVAAVFSNGRTASMPFSVPSSTAEVTGTTAGTVTLGVCVVFNGAGRVAETITLTDVANNTSNALTVTTIAPAGAPERPRAGPPARPDGLS